MEISAADIHSTSVKKVWSVATSAKVAETAANEAAAAQKKADEELAAADKALVDAQAKAKADEEARVKSEADLKTAQDKVNQANQLKQQIDQRVNQVKQQNQAKDYQFALASTPIKLKIEPSPIKLAPLAAPPAVKQEAKQELVVKFERLYGFAEQVELRLEPPQGVPGINVQQVNVPNGQGEGKLEIAAGGNAPVGQHACTLKARARFNNVQVESSTPVTITIEPK